MKKIVVGITGASGSPYAKRLLEVLATLEINTHVVATETGEAVFEYETGEKLEAFISRMAKTSKTSFILEDRRNLFAGIASGSYGFDAVVILPCSMGTLAEIAQGLSRNLLTRAADVALKEKRPLVIVPRETPFNMIHLENMLNLSRAGASILPAMPGFYHQPKTLEELVDFVVGKILDHLKIENQLFEKWQSNK